MRTFRYSEEQLPNTSESSQIVSGVWSEIFKKEYPGYSALVTSEPYGEFVATCMGIEHLSYDVQRLKYPVSASVIRQDPFSSWEFLPDSVKPDVAVKVILLGTESTGKSTLAERLVRHFQGSLVREAGRDLIADSNACTIEDLYRVAAEHDRRIDKAVTGASPLIIIDTDVHITRSYARYLFDRELDREILDANKADLYLYLANDVAFVQDGTRLANTERDLLDKYHRDVLAQYKIEMIEIAGNWNSDLKNP